MKIEDLKEVNILIQYINGIDDFIDTCNENSKSIAIDNGIWGMGIKKAKNMK